MDNNPTVPHKGCFIGLMEAQTYLPHTPSTLTISVKSRTGCGPFLYLLFLLVSKLLQALPNYPIWYDLGFKVRWAAVIEWLVEHAHSPDVSSRLGCGRGGGVGLI